MVKLKIPSSIQLVLSYSVPLFCILLFFIGGLLYHFHTLQVQVFETYQKIKISHEISLKLVDLSEEKYHTQLEVWEYLMIPTPSRLADFQFHKSAFMKKLKALSQDFQDHKDIVDKEAHDTLKLILTKVPQIESNWEKSMKLAKNKAPTSERQKCAKECEAYFDKIDFNARVGNVIQRQNEAVARYETELSQLLQNRNGIFGLLLTFCFGSLVALIHRKSLLVKQNELKLLQASKMAAVGDLSAGLAHELNTFLTVIQGFNARMRAHFKKDRVDKDSSLWEFSKAIDESTFRMKTTVHHFRNFAKSSPVLMEPLALYPVVMSSFNLLSNQAEQARVKTKVSFQAENPMVLGNASSLEQVFLNITKNAIEAFEEITGAQEKNVEVRVFAEDENVVIEFSDNGPGISNKHLDKVFDPFFTTKANDKGTGLGLSVSSGIIEEHKGKIEVTSSIGQGSCFRVTLPLVM